MEEVNNSSLLAAKYIQVIDRAATWQEATKTASLPLLEDGLITQTYVQNMIQNVLDNGPYMVLTDYFALMHAKAGEGVVEQAMSLLVSKNPVDMEGKPIKIFFVLAAKDAKSHLSALAQIMEVFMEEDIRERIMQGNKETIINIFNK